MANKKILVACGTAVATSTVVAKKIEELLKKEGIEATVKQCKASEVPSLAAGCALVVTTTWVGDTKGVPVLKTLSFLTGVGIDKDMETIIEALKK